MLEQVSVRKSKIVSLSVHNVSFYDSKKQVSEWGLKKKSGFVCFANVHMIIEAYHDVDLQRNLQEALLVLPDGKPLAVACDLLYKHKQERVSGMDFMPALFDEISAENGKVFLFGSTPQVLQILTDKVKQSYKGIRIVGSVSPPFRKMTDVETHQYIEQINKSDANFVLVALGCPKQEKWMAQHYRKISGLMLGLGGAFPVFAGIQKRCPPWMREYGFEWLYRLILEPRRLFRRYCVTNFKFLYLFTRQLMMKADRKIDHLNHSILVEQRKNTEAIAR
jgi:N-acetylglucosaminyldiphosphoundecaprenol N-acetyl-beta-D-mannosaminyltransferase